MSADGMGLSPARNHRRWVVTLAALAGALALPFLPGDSGARQASAQTPTSTPTNTPVPPSPTATATFTATPSPTATATFTATPTNTPLSVSPTPTATFTATPSPTATATFTASPTFTPTANFTATPTNTPVPASPTPTTTPTPVTPPAVGLDVTGAVPGQPLFASGTVPDTSQSYTLCLLANAVWTTGSPFSGSCLLQVPLTSPTSAFSGVPLGPAPVPGGYDLLLLGPSGTILAARDASSAAGLLVADGSVVPTGGRAGMIGFALLVAAGAWFLLRQFR